MMDGTSNISLLRSSSNIPPVAAEEIASSDQPSVNMAGLAMSVVPDSIQHHLVGEAQSTAVSHFSGVDNFSTEAVADPHVEVGSFNPVSPYSSILEHIESTRMHSEDLSASSENMTSQQIASLATTCDGINNSVLRSLNNFIFHNPRTHEQSIFEFSISVGQNRDDVLAIKDQCDNGTLSPDSFSPALRTMQKGLEDAHRAVAFLQEAGAAIHGGAHGEVDSGTRSSISSLTGDTNSGSRRSSDTEDGSKAASTHYSQDGFESYHDDQQTVSGGTVSTHLESEAATHSTGEADHQSQHSNATLLSEVNSLHSNNSDNVSLDRLIPPEHQLPVTNPNFPYPVTDSRVAALFNPETNPNV